MITVYSADSQVIRKHRNLSHLLLELPEKMHPKALRYRFARDAYNYVLGRLLLKTGLNEIGLKGLLKDISFADNDKPFLPNVHFNISHSDRLVVCAVSKSTPMGVDIEFNKSIELKNFSSSFTAKEWADIDSHSDAQSRFFWYWTRKESIIKALGKNLAYLHQIEIDATQDYFEAEGQRWYLQDLKMDEGFTGALCTKTQVEIVYKREEF